MARHPTPDILADVLAARPGREQIQLILLDQLDANPYQHRSVGIDDNDDTLIELSNDIAANGIIQPLIVRPHPADASRYQIAAGHRRAAAARLAGQNTAPCVVRTLSDDDMLDIVFAENYHRADINPLDRAHLMRLLADRGLTHQEIADRFSVSRPTVSNALRLLSLPETLQQQVADASLSGRQAEALVSLAQLPDDLIETAKRQWNNNINPHNIIADALAGAPSDQIRKRTADLISHLTIPVQDLPWYSHEFSGHHPDLVSLRCDACPIAIRRDTSIRCPSHACHDSKDNAWAGDLLYMASRASGIPASSTPKYHTNEHETFAFTGDAGQVVLSQQPRCNNIRLAMLPGDHRLTDTTAVDGHPQAIIVCQKYNGTCTCLNRAQKAIDYPDRTPTKRLRDEIQAPCIPLLTAALEQLPAGLLALASLRFHVSYDSIAIRHDSDNLAADIARRAMNQCSEYMSLANNRRVAEQILALAGLRAPWLPSPQSLSQRLSALSQEIDGCQTGNLPTPERMAAIIAELNQVHDEAQGGLESNELAGILHIYHTAWPAAIALQDRVQPQETTP